MVLDLLIVIPLAVWLLLAVCRQAGKREAHQSYNHPSPWPWDIFCLFAHWSFFAPEPIESDYLLYFRVRREDPSGDGWRPSPFPRRRRSSELLLNPKSRCNRVQYSLTRRALEESGNGASVSNGSPHLEALRDLVASLPPADSGAEREFVVRESFGFVTEREPETVLLYPPERSDR